MAARDFGPWTYTDDAGNAYVRSGDKFLTGQLVGGTGPGSIVGGSDASSLTPYNSVPNGLRPRGLYCSNSSGYKAFVVIYDQSVYAAALATPITLNVRDGGGTSHSVTSYKGRPERSERVIRPGG